MASTIDVVLGSISVTICALVAFYNIYINVYISPVPGMAILNVWSISTLICYVLARFCSIVFSRTLGLQNLVVGLCKAVIVNTQAQKIFFFFDINAPLWMQIDKASAFVEGMKPVRTCVRNPCIIIGYAWQGTLNVDKFFIWSAFLRTRIFEAAQVFISWLAAMFYVYDTYGYPNESGHYDWLQFVELFFLMIGLSGLNMLHMVLGPILCPDKRYLYTRKHVAVLIWLVFIEAIQTLIISNAAPEWWFDHGAVVQLIEMVPLMIFWHFANCPPNAHMIAKLDSDEVREALSKIKFTLTHDELIEQGYVINHEVQNLAAEETGEAELEAGESGDLTDTAVNVEEAEF